ncbi:SEL1-like repeat protein [Parachlamydia sp. AcF125]|uniref:SEL1-like repeat protein n=1 Tax=Parachlamydia sp. AcF125 TaxID=2795736 RepID=UPI001BC8D339|nr:SEL1-like repeat protein [Parachlamydia sp. AcF125]MBS4168439.1 Secretory immunoglobulin A-binding protein EsiB [Parachlamydia sp. AcF125]
MNIHVTGFVQNKRLYFSEFSEDNGIQVESSLIRFLKNILAHLGIGKGTLTLRSLDKTWYLNKQSAVNWICKNGETTDVAPLSEKNNQNIVEKINYLYVKKKAEKEIAEACLDLGLLYEAGKGVQQSFEKAYEWYKKSVEIADQKFVVNKEIFYYLAHLKMANLLDKGLGIPLKKYSAFLHYKEAFEGIEREAERKIGEEKPQLLAFLADLYEEGKGTSKFPEKATELYQKAASRGDAYSLAALALKYLQGSGIGRSEDKAFALASQSAKQGHPFGLYVLGLVYYKKGRAKKAEEWIAKSADQGFALAQQKLAQIYEARGSSDDSQIAQLYKKAASQGLPESQYKLAQMYQGGLRGFKLSKEKAAIWYEKAARLGHEEAGIALGKMLCQGEGIEKSFKKALYWLEKAGEKNPKKMERDIAQLMNDWEKLANEGNLRAQLDLGKFYEEKALKNWEETLKCSKETEEGMEHKVSEHYKEVGKQFWEKALKGYEKAAEQGSAEADYRVGRLFAIRRERKILAENAEEKSIEFYKKAAEKGHAKAQSELGKYYFYGLNPSETLEGAVLLLKQARGEEFLIRQQRLDQVLVDWKAKFLLKIDPSIGSHSLSYVGLYGLIENKRKEWEEKSLDYAPIDGAVKELEMLLQCRLNTPLNWGPELLEKADERVNFAHQQLFGDVEEIGLDF